MRLLWKKAPAAQLELLEAKLHSASQPTVAALPTLPSAASESPQLVQGASTGIEGLPLCIPIGLIDEDPKNPRTEFSDAEIDELAHDVRQRGILQPLVVHPADAQGRNRLHFGAKRLRAALRAGLSEVPIVVRDAARPVASAPHRTADPADCGTHSMRRTKATLIYRRTKNLRAVQLPLPAITVQVPWPLGCACGRMR